MSCPNAPPLGTSDCVVRGPPGAPGWDPHPASAPAWGQHGPGDSLVPQLLPSLIVCPCISSPRVEWGLGGGRQTHRYLGTSEDEHNTLEGLRALVTESPKQMLICASDLRGWPKVHRPLCAQLCRLLADE